MKYSPEIYGRAFMETVYAAPQEKQERLIWQFLDVVRKNGDFTQIKKIFAAIQALIIKKNGGRIISLEFARNVSQALLEKFQNNFSSKDHIEISFRPELIAGVRVLINGEDELDLTMRRKLKELFNGI
jgi:F0F1-type ATP synthase delta subunit